MPYILSGLIRTGTEGMWREGEPYSSQVIYDIHSCDPRQPPVQYAAHTLKPHSLPHMDAPAHIIPGGETIDAFFSASRSKPFFGQATVVKLKLLNFIPAPALPGVFFYVVSIQELQDAILKVTGSKTPPERLLLSVDPLPLSPLGEHDQNYAVVLSEEAANWLISAPHFCFYGTSWKSTDFQPGSKERPIHKILFKQAVIFECLLLNEVPEGSYFISSFPLPLEGASESPACPVLFTKAEIAESVSAL